MTFMIPHSRDSIYRMTYTSTSLHIEQKLICGTLRLNIQRCTCIALDSNAVRQLHYFTMLFLHSIQPYTLMAFHSPLHLTIILIGSHYICSSIVRENYPLLSFLVKPLFQKNMRSNNMFKGLEPPKSNPTIRVDLYIGQELLYKTLHLYSS